MPQTISVPHDTTVIDFQKFTTILESMNYDLESIDERFEVSKLFNQLGNNHSFLIDLLSEQIINQQEKLMSNVYSQNTFTLYRSAKYLIRANIWLPDPAFHTDNIYNIYHDHNFDLLTIGFVGSGYQTHVLTYDNSHVTGLIDELVNVKDCGIIRLSKGQILYYKAKCDIHNQIPPEDLSISINLIPLKNAFEFPQFEFDKRDFKILRRIHISSKELILKMTKEIEFDERYVLYKSILSSKNNPYIKALAAYNLVTQYPQKKSEINALLKQEDEESSISAFIEDIKKQPN